MRGVAVATIFAKNYMAFARVLINSFRAYHAEVPFFAVLADEVDGYFDPAAEPFRWLQLADVGIPNLTHFRFRYSLKQVAAAAKPYVLNHVLDQGFRTAIFLDPDILVPADLTSLFTQASQHAIVLLPHLLAPLGGKDRIARELNILQSGVYNAGCVGVTDSPSGREFLGWWQHRVLAHCDHDVPAGVYYDQRWLDLARVFFDDVFVLRDSSYNVAHWNLPERRMVVSREAVVVDGKPCRFFHFSGFDPDHPHAVTRYSPRLTMDNIGSAAELFRRYLALLEAAGYHETKTWPYAYDRFDNGVSVSNEARKIHQQLGEAAVRFGDPLVTTTPDSFFDWLNQSAKRSARLRARIQQLPGALWRRLAGRAR